MLTQERSGLTKAWDLTTVRNAAFYVMIEVPVSASKLGVSCELNTYAIRSLHILVFILMFRTVVEMACLHNAQLVSV